MKVLGIGGSPRKGGNSDTLLDRALAGANGAGASVEKIVLNDLNFKPCQECGGCDKTGACVLMDDMELVYKKLDEADAVILASPIFFGSITGQLKMMIDRFHCRWVLKYVLKKSVSPKKKKRGIFLCVGGKEKDVYFESAKTIIKVFFAVLDIEYAGDLFFKGVDKKTGILENKDAMKKAFELGRELVRS